MSELKIKTAAEYAAAVANNEDIKVTTLREKAIAFINGEVVPEIEDRIANPGNYTSKNSASFKNLHFPSREFYAMVASLLTPLGYEVVDTHDGGGMYAMILIRWGTKK